MNPPSSIENGDVSSRRGLIYFCEVGLNYCGGVRAWLFFGPYLLGAIALEPGLNSGSKNDLDRWLLFVAYLVIFPPVWRALLRHTGLWRKRTKSASGL
jgi:hypothetical protein